MPAKVKGSSGRWPRSFRHKRKKFFGPKTRRAFRKGGMSNSIANDIPLAATLYKRSPFGIKKRCVMAMTEYAQITTPVLSATFGTEILFRLNSIFSPSFQQPAHQPYGYDQLTPIYRKYKVHGVRVQITFSDPTTDGLFVGATFQQANEAATLTGVNVSNAGDKSDTVTLPINNTGTQLVNIDKYFPMNKLCGLSKLQYSADTTNYSAVMGANPTNTPILRIALANPAATLAQYTCGVMVKILFYATFYERIDFGSS